MVNEVTSSPLAIVSPTPLKALLITDDWVLARTLANLLQQLPTVIELHVTSPNDVDDPVDIAPDIVFVDCEGRPSVLKAARLRYPQAKFLAVVGWWSETAGEVRGFADRILYKPLRATHLAPLGQLLPSYPTRLSA